MVFYLPVMIGAVSLLDTHAEWSLLSPTLPLPGTERC